MKRQRGPAAASSVTVTGNNAGIIAVGDYTTSVQLQMVGDTAQVHDLTELHPPEISVIGTLREQEPVGRATIVGQVAAQLRARTSVQLYGPPGIGKKAITRAVIRELSHDGVRGTELRPRLSQGSTLSTIYEQLAGVFFHVNMTDPAEEQLRTAAREISALVVIYDCELPADQVARLLATFPGCVFLLTSQGLTIGRAGAAREIEPLDRRSALTLVTQELGHEPLALQQAQLEQACDLAAGQVQRLLLYGAFLKSTEGRPGHRPLPELTGAEVAAMVAGGLSEPARQVLVALATFGAGLAPGLFAAVTGLAPPQPPQQPGRDPAGIATELLTARLVTQQGSEIWITPDANSAVRSAWPPASAPAAARGLLPLLTSGDAAQPVSADLLVALARQLSSPGEDAQLATRFIRVAAPSAMRARQTRAWIQLTALGLREAMASGSQPDLEYFLQEEHTRALFQGDKAAAAAALVELLNLQHAAPPPAAQASHPGHPGRPGRPRGRVRHWLGAHSATQIGAMAAVTAVLAAGAFGGAYKVATALNAGPHPAPPAQLTGSQLMAALLPQSDFFTGRSQTIAADNFSTGGSLVPYNAAAEQVSCQLLSVEIHNANARQEASNLGLTAVVRRVNLTPAAATDSGTPAEFVDYQEIYQRPGLAQAKDFFRDIQPCATQPGSTVQSSGITHLSVGSDPAIVYTLSEVSAESQPLVTQRVLIVQDGPDVFQLGLQVSDQPASALPSLARHQQLMLSLIASVRRA